MAFDRAVRRARRIPLEVQLELSLLPCRCTTCWCRESLVLKIDDVPTVEALETECKDCRAGQHDRLKEAP